MLDTREGMLHGGDTGPAIAPGKPEDSLLIDAVSYKDADLQMPPKGDKLSDQQVADLTEWIRRGAPDPRSLVAKGSSLGLRRRRARPLVVSCRCASSRCPPCRHRLVPDAGRQLHPGEAGGNGPEAQPAGRQVHADPPGDLRPDRPAADRGRGPAASWSTTRPRPRPRWSTGCSPRRTTASAGAATGSTSPATPTPRATRPSGRIRRYPFAWTYRDYVIDAFNSDKPYNQFIVEQLAADRLVSAEQKSGTARTPARSTSARWPRWASSPSATASRTA